MITQFTNVIESSNKTKKDTAFSSNQNYNNEHKNNCNVDTDAFNQFLQCCFDPSHLNMSNAYNIIDNKNIGKTVQHNNCHSRSSSINTPLPPTSVSSTATDSINSPSSNVVNMEMINMDSIDSNNMNKDINHENTNHDNTTHNDDNHIHLYNYQHIRENNSSNYPSSSSSDRQNVKSHTELTLPGDILNCCTPIDLNPCCVTENHDLSNSAQYCSNKCNHDHDHDHQSNHYNKHQTELSEMVILNNFFSACCNDTNLDVPTAATTITTETTINKYPSLISPPISTAKPTKQVMEIYPKTLTTADKISNIRDSLKNTTNTVNNTNTNNNHHHHLLHLHHHNAEDSTRSHTHDIIFHHHNAHGCVHNNNTSHHHHHLHFEDQIDGEIIKHDFILPDCDIKNENSLNDSQSINTTLDPSTCTDFLTSSICNLDSIFSNAEVKLENSEFDQCLNHGHRTHSNITLPSQKKYLPQSNNENLKTHLQHHHHLQHQHHHHQHQHQHQHHHHNHDSNSDCNCNTDHLHEGHFHCHNHPTHTTINNNNNSKPIKVKLESISPEKNVFDGNFLNHDSLICKWNDCNTAIDSDNFDDHLFKTHLQYLPLSPGVYDNDNEYDEQVTNSIKRNNMLLHCGWDHCDFTTSDIDKFLEHVPEHTDLLKKKEITESENENEKDVHICQWVDPETGIECGKYFDLTENLTNHIISDHITSGKSSYTCHWKGCNRSEKPFSQRQKIIRHMNTHTKYKPFECEICHKKFSLDLMLKQHMRIHTGEKPYKCDLCGKNFKTSSSLTIHLRIHSGDKPMVCKICGKRFNESSNLNKHMKIHFRKYKCELCLKSFDTETKYKRHQSVCKNKLMNKKLIR
ncbi:hypothetical protein C6P40_000849 [Pichia californica]|uniref:C2H2-type domain-containing protein n=1 Tax=Pichia californica TaxID=460514 RepID=A0A9P6WJX9_9ASCO|nr:hypothetical protein C6P40_000849 [[Candida] californica]